LSQDIHSCREEHALFFGAKQMMLNKKKLVRVLLDSASWFTASWLASLLRFDGQLPPEMNLQVFRFGILAAILSFLVCASFSLYAGKYRNASLEEVLTLVLAVTLSTVLLFSARVLAVTPNVPRSVPIISGVLSLIFMLAFRVLLNPRSLRSFSKKSKGERTLIYGAGIAGRQLAEQMLVQGDQYNPIGFLDDDASVSNLRIFGRPVLGTINELEYIVASQSPVTLIVAISGVESSLLLDLERRCRSLGVKLRIIPTAHEIISGAVRLADIEDISEEDLLGRRPVSSDNTEIEAFIRGKRVLVTGAGGSIGSEISRQVYRYGPESLTLVDRDETALLNLQLSLDGTGTLTNDGLVLADIRDSSRIREIFAATQPEIVFHAAALKHLTTLERFPEEAYKTNVLGTVNVLKAAQENKVKTFINISTDKAADPLSALGKSKLTAEKLTAGIKTSSSRYISVRFGNVIGSNGSFIHTFRHQIKCGGPITITHPEVTRFFMTVSEAVHLVLHSALIGRHGETLILDMGHPVGIDSIARHMIEVSGRNIDIKYTGLREGEKLHEILVSSAETTEIRNHPFIMHTKVNPVMSLEEIQ
jgi:dTDP-glucose 4,6-dehydratase